MVGISTTFEYREKHNWRHDAQGAALVLLQQLQDKLRGVEISHAVEDSPRSARGGSLYRGVRALLGIRPTDADDVEGRVGCVGVGLDEVIDALHTFSHISEYFTIFSSVAAKSCKSQTKPIKLQES